MNTQITSKDMEIIKATGDVFIIPNAAVTRESFINEIIPESEQDMLLVNEISERNPMFVECWIASNEFNTENLRDHGGHINDETRINIHTSYIPAILLNGHKEGETVTVKFMASKHTRDTHELVILEMKLTLSQLKYRYKNHGKFEECFNKITIPNL